MTGRSPAPTLRPKVVARRTRAIHAAAAALLCAAPALAQESYPKLLRYDENYRHLADPAARTGAFDAVKYIPLDDDADIVLTLHGEARARVEAATNPAFGLTGAGATGNRRDGVLLHRLLLGADLHVGPAVRVFAQLGSYGQTGRNGGALPTDRNDLDLQQGFVDVQPWADGEARATLRVGRQEILFGSGRLVAVREGPNGRRSFDGVRAMYRSPRLDVEVFATRPVALRPALFDDTSDDMQGFWGSYAVFRPAEGRGVDLYYLGQDRDHAVYAAGAGPERRHTLGLRLWGQAGSADLNAEAMFQFGRFAGSDIRAYALSLDTGYRFDAVPFTPRLGIQANVESGDRDPADGRLGTFNSLYPNHAYFSEAAFGAPMNAYDLQPNVTLTLAPRLTLMTGLNFFWRHRIHDAIYNSVLTPFAGTDAVPGRYIGTMSTTHVRWQATPQWEINLDYSRFGPGEVLRNAGAGYSDFLMGSVHFRF